MASISLQPSSISDARASRISFSIGYSREMPLPPKIWSASLATSKAVLVTKVFDAMQCAIEGAPPALKTATRRASAARGLDFREHLEQARLHALVLDDRHAALDALVRVGERVVVGGAGEPDEDLTHARIGVREHHLETDGVEVGPERHVALGDAHVVEVELALVEAALSELVERTRALDAGQVERHEEDAAALEALALVERAEEHRHVGDRAVRHPGRLLAA